MGCGRGARQWAAVALLALGGSSTPGSLEAQTTSASVSGQVKDSLGGAVLGAAVELTSRTQANTLRTTTDAEGRFVFPIVRPDAYTLRVSRQGFKAPSGRTSS